MNDSITLAMALALESGDTAAANAIASMPPASLKKIIEGYQSTAFWTTTPTVTGRSRRRMSDELYTKALDQKQAGRLLANAEDATADTIHEIILDAVPKYNGGPLLDQKHLDKLAETLASINSTANLLGRAKTRLNIDRIIASGQPLRTFADDPVTSIKDAIPVIRSPQEAVEYFMSLFPSLGIDPLRFVGEQRRRAFTLAASTNETLTRKVQEAIAAGLKENQSTRDITAAIEDRLRDYGAMGRHPQYASMVARTNINDSLTTGIYEEGQGDDVKDYFPVWLYTGILDNRTGDDHRPKIGNYYPREVTFADARGPRVYNCILPRYHVHARVLETSKAFYAGEVVEIYTSRGCRLCVTPNHPIATDQGWIRADDICKGLNAVCYFGKGQVSTFGVNEKDCPALIEDVCEALEVICLGSRSAKVSALDFYGDGKRIKGKINIIRADRPLMDGWNWKIATQQSFPWRDMQAKLKPSLRAFALNLKGIFLAATGFVSAANLIDPFWNRHSRPFEGFRFGLGSELDASIDEPMADCRTINPSLLRQLIDRFPGKVSFDKIISVNRKFYEGHVYDLGTSTGYFVAGDSISQGILISNCRCGPSWVDYMDWREQQAQGKRTVWKV